LVKTTNLQQEVQAYLEQHPLTKRALHCLAVHNSKLKHRPALVCSLNNHRSKTCLDVPPLKALVALRVHQQEVFLVARQNQQIKANQSYLEQLLLLLQALVFSAVQSQQSRLKLLPGKLMVVSLERRPRLMARQDRQLVVSSQQSLQQTPKKKRAETIPLLHQSSELPHLTSSAQRPIKANQRVTKQASQLPQLLPHQVKAPP
jgi:hypothetical protein